MEPKKNNGNKDKCIPALKSEHNYIVAMNEPDEGIYPRHVFIHRMTSAPWKRSLIISRACCCRSDSSEAGRR